MGAERVPRLSSAKARKRMLLEEENVRAFEKLLRELGAESLLLIGGMGVRALVGGWARHGRYTLDVDAVACVSLDRVAAAAGPAGPQVRQLLVPQVLPQLVADSLPLPSTNLSALGPEVILSIFAVKTRSFPSKFPLSAGNRERLPANPHTRRRAARVSFHELRSSLKKSL